jgi:hypothetical protein
MQPCPPVHSQRTAIAGEASPSHGAFTPGLGGAGSMPAGFRYLSENAVGVELQIGL